MVSIPNIAGARTNSGVNYQPDNKISDGVEKEAESDEQPMVTDILAFDHGLDYGQYYII